MTSPCYDQHKSFENSQSQKTENSDLEAGSEIEAEDSDSESTTISRQKGAIPCQHCKGSNVYHTAVMKCPSCFWHDNRETYPVQNLNIPIHRKHMKDDFTRNLILDVELSHTITGRKQKRSFTFLKRKETINCVLMTLLCTGWATEIKLTRTIFNR